MNILRFVSSSYVAILFSLIGCQDLGQPYEPPRVLPGVSIDGVYLGETMAQVESRLGKGGLGSGDGVYKSQLIEWYSSGPNAGLDVGYIDLIFLGLSSGPGPVDDIFVESPYTGRTAEGIGLGSTIGDVRSAYGIPQRTWHSGDFYDVHDDYCFAGHTFTFYYANGFVKSMGLGVLYPTPLDTLCQ